MFYAYMMTTTYSIAPLGKNEDLDSLIKSIQPIRDKKPDDYYFYINKDFRLVWDSVGEEINE